MRHIIKKQVLQLLVDSGLDAFRLQQAASEYYWREILPVLESLFDELSTEGETIRLDRLELDLGLLMEDLFRGGRKRELYEVLRRQLQAALLKQDRFRDIPLLRESGAEQALRRWWYYMEHGRLHWGQDVPTSEWHREVLEMFSTDHAAISRLKEAIVRNERLLVRVSAQHGSSFLETLTGILVAGKQERLGESVEWVVRVSFRLEELMVTGGRGEIGAVGLRAALPNALRAWRGRHRVFLALARQERKEGIWRWILRQAVERPAVFRSGGAVRLIAQWFWGGEILLPGLLAEEGVRLPDGPKEFLVMAPLAKRSRGKSEGVGDIVSRREGKTGNPTDVDDNGGLEGQEFKSAEGAETIGKRETPGDGEEAQVPNAPLENRDRAKSGVGEEGKGTESERPKREGKGSTEPGRELDEKMGVTDAGGGSDDLSAAKKVAGEVDEPVSDVALPDGEGPLVRGGEPELSAEMLFSENDVDEEGTYIPHAGVILLHPFLSTCFSRLQWWEEGEFSEGARVKAVFMIHYLATGLEEAPEFELVLPKVLCGLSPETPMPGKMDLTAEEYAEAEELLQMVLIRWDKLKGTSVEGLREGFLKRGGKLFRRNERLTLVVEAHAIDVLLDYLPWGLSIVKLPWMNEIIYVEWR